MADITQQCDVLIDLIQGSDGYTLSDTDKQLVRRLVVRGNYNIKFKIEVNGNIRVWLPLWVVYASNRVQFAIGTSIGQFGIEGKAIDCGEVTPEDFQDTIPADE